MNVSIFWVHTMECMCALTRPRFILASKRVNVLQCVISIFYCLLPEDWFSKPIIRVLMHFTRCLVLSASNKLKVHKSLNPSQGHEGVALLNAAPVVSTSDSHGQGFGLWQSSFLSTLQYCPSISFSACPFFCHLELCLGGRSSIGHWLLSHDHTIAVVFMQIN